MASRSIPIPRALALATGLGLAAGLLLTGPAGIAQPIQGPQPTQDSLRDAVKSSMLTNRGPAARSSYDRQDLAEPVIDSKRASARLEWAFGTATIPAPYGVHATPESALYLARHTSAGWQVEVDGTAGFAELSAKAPESVVSKDEKDLFAASHTATTKAAAATGLALPWRTGDSWWMGGGPHGDSGSSRPFNSVDFNGNGGVGAARAGRVYKSCVRNGSGLVRVVHDNGYSTTYYHMYQLTNLADGAAVAAGTYLGVIGNGLPCGGSTSGAHVHFSLLYNGNAEPVNGKTIGGWTFREGGQPYQGYAERAGRKVYPGNGTLTNYGPGDPGPGPTLPTGTVNSGTNQTTNLRSGPSLRHSVVGTARTGDVVRISCTARGDAVDGVWGRTDLWNRLDTGSWISDGFVDTGSSGPVAPTCTS